MLTRVAADDLAAFGPFFALRTHSANSAVTEPWHTMRELIEDPSVLRAQVAGVRAHLATAAGQAPEAVSPRVAASVTQLGLVARLVSPALGFAVVSGRVLDLDLARIRWQRVLGGGFPLSVPASPPTDAAGTQDSLGDHPELDHLAAGLARQVVSGPVREVVEAVLPLSVSARVLWGNVASAVNGAASMIETTRPAWAQRARAVASLLLNQPPLRHTSTLNHDGTFQRRSCCLIYRAVPHTRSPVCGDCVLATHRIR